MDLFVDVNKEQDGEYSLINPKFLEYLSQWWGCGTYTKFLHTVLQTLYPQSFNLYSRGRGPKQCSEYRSKAVQKFR